MITMHVPEASRHHSFPIAIEKEAVSKTCRLLLSVIEEWDLHLPDETIDELALLSSEVIANALRHTTGRCTTTVHWSGTRLRVEVGDLAGDLGEGAGRGRRDALR
ncbi:hypothetical protein ACGFNX_28250 [Streptomyces sp. NPDC048723]|uniref:hypothetical protein n=1 Tax=Streptomyces sp. NPDC048723 TaxID=3365589 RepID=UPI003711BADE